MDAIDQRILAEVQADSAISLPDLAARVGLSKNPCWRRLKRLEAEGVITGRVALLSPARLGLGLQAFIAVRTDRHDQDWAESFRAVVQDFPEIVGAYRMTGEIDYLLQAWVPDMAAYDALYQRLIARIALSDVSSSFVMEQMKSTTALPLDYLETAVAG